jgi:hypothetical protein
METVLEQVSPKSRSDGKVIARHSNIAVAMPKLLALFGDEHGH